VNEVKKIGTKILDDFVFVSIQPVSP